MVKNAVAAAKTVTLESFAKNTSKALKQIFEIMTDADRLRLGALYGSIGFLAGGAGCFELCSQFGAPHIALASSAAAGIAGLLGVRLSYSRTDIVNKRMQALIADATEQRDEEVRKIDAAIKRYRSSDPEGVRLLKLRRSALMMASNDHLLRWAKLVPPDEEDERNPLLLPPPPQLGAPMLPAPNLANDQNIALAAPVSQSSS